MKLMTLGWKTWKKEDKLKKVVEKESI